MANSDAWLDFEVSLALSRFLTALTFDKGNPPQYQE